MHTAASRHPFARSANWYMRIKCILCEGERQGAYCIWRGGGVGGPLKHVVKHHPRVHAALQAVVELVTGGASDKVVDKSGGGAKGGAKRGVKGGRADEGAGTDADPSPTAPAAFSSPAVASAAQWCARGADIFSMSLPEINAELAPAAVVCAGEHAEAGE